MNADAPAVASALAFDPMLCAAGPGAVLVEELKALGLGDRILVAPGDDEDGPLWAIREGLAPEPFDIAIAPFRARGGRLLQILLGPAGPMGRAAVDLLFNADVVIAASLDDWRRLLMIGQIAGAPARVLWPPLDPAGRGAFWRALAADIDAAPDTPNPEQDRAADAFAQTRRLAAPTTRRTLELLQSFVQMTGPAPQGEPTWRFAPWLCGDARGVIETPLLTAPTPAAGEALFLQRNDEIYGMAIVSYFIDAQ